MRKYGDEFYQIKWTNYLWNKESEWNRHEK